jgi:hypothetical protein
MPNIPEPDTCPTDIDETAESYIMETMPRAGALHFEDHYITCSNCAVAVEEAGQYVRAMTMAADMLRMAAQR